MTFARHSAITRMEPRNKASAELAYQVGQQWIRTVDLRSANERGPIVYVISAEAQTR